MSGLSDIVVRETDAPTRETSPASPDRELPEGYYVHAFSFVLDTVTASSSDLLTPEESAWAARFRALSENARRLYVRLLQRKPSVFRLSKLSYTDIADIPAAWRELVSAGLATDLAPGSIEELAAAFTVSELKRLVPVECPGTAPRVTRVAALINRDAAADREALAGADTWITLRGYAYFSVFKLCFFGNLYQDLSEFVTTALGTHHYPKVSWDSDNPYFQTREQIEAHLRYFECAQALSLLRAKDPDALDECVARLPLPIENDAHLKRRLNRLRLAIAQAYERLDERAKAIALYRASDGAVARERLVRALEHETQTDEAQALLRRMYADPETEAEYDFAARKLGSKDPRAKAFKPAMTSLVLSRVASRVELDVREFYARDGACYWVENRLFSSVLGLWIWDIVFAPIRGAFFNPFQSAPADFREREFRRARAHLLSRRFDELNDDEAFRHRIASNLKAHDGSLNPLVNWELARSAVLPLALQRIPRAAWSVVFDRMLDDLGEHTSGLPDLVHFPAAGGYELIEVKGPGDALQANQRRWFRFFNEQDIPARVVKVSWARRS